MKRYVRSDSLNSADYEGYNKYIGVVEGMIDQGDDIDDVVDYIQDLYKKGKIENYEKNMLRKDARDKAWDKEQESMTEDDLASYYGQKPGTYSVSAFGNAFMEPVGAPIIYSNPGNAIQKWFQLNESYPTCVMITGYRGKDEQALRDWAVNHEDKIIEWAGRYASPYGSEYILDECRKPVRPSNLKYPDQLHPFGLG